MKRIKVESSTIKSIGYDTDDFILEVEFVKGSIYQYENVMPNVIVQLLFSESIGSFFMRNISKEYKYEKVSN